MYEKKKKGNSMKFQQKKKKHNVAVTTTKTEQATSAARKLIFCKNYFEIVLVSIYDYYRIYVKAVFSPFDDQHIIEFQFRQTYLYF